MFSEFAELQECGLNSSPSTLPPSRFPGGPLMIQEGVPNPCTFRIKNYSLKSSVRLFDPQAKFYEKTFREALSSTSFSDQPLAASLRLLSGASASFEPFIYPG